MMDKRKPSLSQNGCGGSRSCLLWTSILASAVLILSIGILSTNSMQRGQTGVFLNSLLSPLQQQEDNTGGGGAGGATIVGGDPASSVEAGQATHRTHNKMKEEVIEEGEEAIDVQNMVRDPSKWLDTPSPFRYAKKGMSLLDIIGRHPKNAAAACELMVLGSPKCEAYLTGEVKSSHPEGGAMMECLERYGVVAWGKVLQPQCTDSSFWQDLSRRLEDKPPKVHLTDLSVLMDPIMKQHVGPMHFPYVPPSKRTYAQYSPPLVCRPPPLDVEELEALRRLDKNTNTIIIDNSTSLTYSHLELDDEVAEAVGAGHLPPRPRGPLVVHPIGLGHPVELLVRKPYRHKLFDWFPVLPAYYPYFMPQLFKKRPVRAHYPALPIDEFIFTMVMRLSYFAWTFSRGGHECSRHYEISCSGTLPYYYDIGLMPNWTVSGLPRPILKSVLTMPGVDHYGPVDNLVSAEERRVYLQEDYPPSVKQRFKTDRMLLLERRRKRQRSIIDEEAAMQELLDSLNADLSSESERNAFLEQTYADQIAEEEEDAAADLVVNAWNHPPYPFTATQNAFAFRVAEQSVFNVRGVGKVDWTKMNRHEYFSAADDLWRFAKNHLSDGSIAAYFLRVLQREEPQRILFFAAAKGDNMAVTLLRGLAELGMDVTVCSVVYGRHRELFSVPLEKSTVVLPLDTMRTDFGVEGSIPMMNGSAYHRWRRQQGLEVIYGKNFFIGKRTPRLPLISEAEACSRIAANEFDVIVLGYTHFFTRFDMHVCAKELRARDRSKVVAAHICGSDGINIQTTRSYFEEGFVTFAREPRCW